MKVFGSVLEKNEILFDYLPTFYSDDHGPLSNEPGDEGSDDDDTNLPAYFRQIIDFDLVADKSYHYIIDLSVADLHERSMVLRHAASVFPNAIIIASVLTATATEIGAMTGTANRIVGVGIAPGSSITAPVIDVCRGLNCSDEAAAEAFGFLKSLGYQTEEVADRIALVQMRTLVTLINEAAFAVMEGVGTPEEIDTAMQLGVSYPKGLLAWADEIGIGVVTLILEHLHREYGQERYRPCVLLKQYLRAGWTGKVSGRGFFRYV